MDHFRAGKKRKLGKPGRPAWQPAQDGRGAGTPPEWAGLGAGPGRQRGRGVVRPGEATRVGRPGNRPRPVRRPEAHPRGPARNPDQAGRVAVWVAERAGLGAGPGRR